MQIFKVNLKQNKVKEILYSSQSSNLFKQFIVQF